LFFTLFDFLKIDKSSRAIGVVAIGVILILVGGLRWETGTDWDNYYYYFDSNYSYDDFVNGQHEYLYALLSFTVKQLSESYTVFLLLFCFFMISLKLYGFSRVSNLNFIFLTLLFYYANQLGDVSGNRQSLALSFAVIGLIFLVEKNLIMFLVVTTIAFYFHTSAIIMILAIPLMYITITRQRLILIIAVGFAVGIFISFTGSNNFLFAYLMSGDGHIAAKLIAYDEIKELGNSTTGSSIDPKVSYILGTVRRCFVLLPSLIFYERLEKNKNFRLLLNMYVVGSLIYLIFTPVIQVLNRMSAYFDISEFLILPLFIKISSQKYIRVCVYIILVLYAFAKFYSNIMSFWTFYTPYKLCF
jgi:hypothetical protein